MGDFFAKRICFILMYSIYFRGQKQVKFMSATIKNAQFISNCITLFYNCLVYTFMDSESAVVLSGGFLLDYYLTHYNKCSNICHEVHL